MAGVGALPLEAHKKAEPRGRRRVAGRGRGSRRPPGSAEGTAAARGRDCSAEVMKAGVPGFGARRAPGRNKMSVARFQAGRRNASSALAQEERPCRAPPASRFVTTRLVKSRLDETCPEPRAAKGGEDMNVFIGRHEGMGCSIKLAPVSSAAACHWVRSRLSRTASGRTWTSTTASVLSVSAGRPLLIYRKEGARPCGNRRVLVKAAQIGVVGLRDGGWTDLGKCKWGPVRAPRAVARELGGQATAFPNRRGATIGQRIFSRQRPARADKLPGCDGMGWRRCMEGEGEGLVKAWIKGPRGDRGRARRRGPPASWRRRCRARARWDRPRPG